MKKIALTTILSLILATSLMTNTFAADSKIDNKAASKFISDIGQKVINIAKGKSSSEQKMRQEIVDVVDQSIDSTWIARFVFGKSYRIANDKQKEEFKTLYREFMINTYGPKFRNYNGKEFKVLEANYNGKFYLVKCEFLQKNSKVPVKIDFRVKNENNKFLIIDFIAEGISLIETHRSEFDSAITNNGLARFLKDLKMKVDALKYDSMAKKI